MPVVKEIKMEEGFLLLWKIEEETSWLINQLPELKNDPVFLQLKNKKRQREWLVVKMMLKHIRCDNLQVIYNELGQPKISHSLYNFISISHSNELAGIFLHINKKTGLDIESQKRNFETVASKYLAANEIKLAQVNKKLYSLFWCAKEAIYKVSGISGIHFANQIRLTFQNNQLTGELITTHKQYFQINYFDYEEHDVVFLLDEGEKIEQSENFIR